MTPERWQQIERLLDGALELPAEQRAVFLEEQCAGDAALRNEVEEIIAAGESDMPLPISPVSLAGPLLAGLERHSTSVPVRERIGAYRLVRVLGEGGMGTVYLAERDDGEFRQTVALKLVRRGLHQDERILRRFREERQILASLQHPDIARLLDGGITEDGLPWFTMEFVDGEPIDRYCDAHHLSIDGRLALFAQVCDAMAHAHRAGIVHRDLKPSNILVTSGGTPKLLDFGIAKLTAPDEDAGGVTGLTRTGERLLTPEYASPEQIRGDAVTPAADVFSLGVLLYELLTGRRPYGGGGGARHGLERAILEEEPTRPSSAVRRTGAGEAAASLARAGRPRGNSPEQLQRRLRGDLDTLVLRALRKEPARRYRDAGELAAELQRHLEGRPIVARGEDRLYRLAKAARRHRAAIGAALAAATLASAGAIALLDWSRDELLVPGTTRRIAFDAALELDPALSPDGRRLVYAMKAEGAPRLFLADLATGSAAALADPMPGGQRSPRWSPDGREILFQADDRIYGVSADGGTASVRIEPEPPGQWVRSPAWSPDGREIAYVQDHLIHVRPAAGGPSRRLTTGAREPHSLAWSPDGRWIAYVDGNLTFVYGAWGNESLVNLGNAGPSSLWLVPARGGTPVQLSDATALNMSPVWLPGGRALLFVSNRDGGRDVYRLVLRADGRPAGAAQRVTTGLGAHTIALSADGRRLAYSLLRNLANVWSASLPGEVEPAEAALRPVTRGTQLIEGLSVSSDGEWIAFDSDRNGNQDIYIQSLGGGEAVQLTRSPADDFMPHWSPDGRELAYYTFLAGGNRQLRVMRRDGSEVQSVVDEPRDQRFPSWSPDGSSLVFASNEGGAHHLYLVSRDGAGRWRRARRLIPDSGAAPRWSPDGREIAFASPSGIWVVGAAGGVPRHLVAVPDAPSTLGNLEWHPDGRSILFKRFDLAGNASFWSVPASGGEPRLLLRLDESVSSRRPEFATDGRRLFFTVGERESDVWVMELATARR